VVLGDLGSSSDDYLVRSPDGVAFTLLVAVAVASSGADTNNGLGSADFNGRDESLFEDVNGEALVLIVSHLTIEIGNGNPAEFVLGPWVLAVE
jgi:hypothetical protein